MQSKTNLELESTHKILLEESDPCLVLWRNEKNGERGMGVSVGRMEENGEKRGEWREFVWLCVCWNESFVWFMWLDLTKRVSGFERLQDYPFGKYWWICMQGFIGNLYGQVRWLYGLTLGHNTSQSCMQGHTSHLLINKSVIKKILKEWVLVNKVQIYNSWN